MFYQGASSSLERVNKVLNFLKPFLLLVALAGFKPLPLVLGVECFTTGHYINQQNDTHHKGLLCETQQNILYSSQHQLLIEYQ
jgi:hypothetical protein